MLKTKFFLIVAIFWTLFITYLSLAAIEGISSRFPLPHKDKFVHFVFYFGFVYWWSKGICDTTTQTRRVIVVSAVGYGLLMELLQMVLTKNRAADIWDVLANTLGAFTAYYWMTKRNI